MRLFWAAIAITFAGAVAGMPEIETAPLKNAPPELVETALPGETNIFTRRFEVYRPGVTRGCGLSARIDDATGTTQLATDPDCGLIYTPLSHAVTWRDGKNGSVSIIGRAGEIIAEFAPGDGLAYESVYPASPLLLLVTQDDE